MVETKIIDIEELVIKDEKKVKEIIASANLEQSSSISRSVGNLVPKATTFYSLVLDNLSDGTRNTPNQVEYLNIYEKALGVFRQTSTELRRNMDVLTLEQRLESQLANVKERTELKEVPKEVYESALKLGSEISDAVHFSNKYALAFAGKIGLALLGSSDVTGEKIFQFNEKQRASKDRDDLTRTLALVGSTDFKNILASVEEKKDEVLKHTLEAIFTSWTRQLDFKTWEDVVSAREISGIKLQYGKYSSINGEFKEKNDVIEVDDKFMRSRKKDIIGNKEFVESVWSNMLRLSAYDFEEKDNPLDPASVVFTFGAPGGGKTFVAHSLIQSFGDYCREQKIPLKAITHSVTDYASHYQNATANNLQQLAEEIKKFQGLVVMYVADADTLFKSRQDPNLTAEQQNTMGVYFKMFDGTMIAKDGRFMAIMDANYIDGIDEATKSRLFDEIIELKRYQTIDEWAEYMRRGLEGKIKTEIMSSKEWLRVGEFLLSTDLSAREVNASIKKLRRGYDVTSDVLALDYVGKVNYRNQYLKGLNGDKIIDTVQTYIDTRVQIERASYEAKQKLTIDRFLVNLETPHKATQ